MRAQGCAVETGWECYEIIFIIQYVRARIVGPSSLIHDTIADMMVN